FPGTTQLELSTGAFLWIQATSPLFVSSSTPCLMHTACIDPTTVHGAYTGKTIAATHTFQSQKVGGAGGIRTHEWRFCRPLPWAAWVPRQARDYTKSSVSSRCAQARCSVGRFLLLLAHCRDSCFPQKSCRLFRRRGINIKPCSPF